MGNHKFVNVPVELPFPLLPRWWYCSVCHSLVETQLHFAKSTTNYAEADIRPGSQDPNSINDGRQKGSLPCHARTRFLTSQFPQKQSVRYVGAHMLEKNYDKQKALSQEKTLYMPTEHRLESCTTPTSLLNWSFSPLSAKDA